MEQQAKNSETANATLVTYTNTGSFVLPVAIWRKLSMILYICISVPHETWLIIYKLESEAKYRTMNPFICTNYNV